jgi:putative FmdB family regulatory protein
MPTYDYSCSACDAAFELLLRMSQREIPLQEPCPTCSATNTITQSITAPSIGDPIRLGIKRPDAGWNDVLKKVKDAHPRGMAQSKFSPSAGR